MEFSNVYWDTNKGITVFLEPAGERRDVSKVCPVETRLLLGLQGKRMNGDSDVMERMSLRKRHWQEQGRRWLCMTQLLEKICFWSSTLVVFSQWMGMVAGQLHSL